MTALWKTITRYKLWLGAAVVLVAVAGFTASYLYAAKPAAPAGTTVAVGRGTIDATVSATGTINPENMVDISSKITGLVEEVKVAENDQVKTGQVLLVLDDTHLQAQTDQARARLANASAAYERSQRLMAVGAVSAEQLDAARTDWSVARAAYDDAIAQHAETIIRSPIDGRIIGKPIPAGQTVAPGISSPMVLMTVADMAKLQIDALVDESDIGKVRLGQPVTFTVDAYPGKVYTGVVANISDKATIQQNVVYYNVRVTVGGDAGDLKPSMTARVTVNVGESKDVLTVPLAAVKSGSGGQQFVVVAADKGQTKNVPVTTGLIGEDKVEIKSGLAEGDKVVVAAPKPAGAQASGGNFLRGAGR